MSFFVGIGAVLKLFDESFESEVRSGNKVSDQVNLLTYLSRRKTRDKRVKPNKIMQSNFSRRYLKNRKIVQGQGRRAPGRNRRNNPIFWEFRSQEPESRRKNGITQNTSEGRGFILTTKFCILNSLFIITIQAGRRNRAIWPF